MTWMWIVACAENAAPIPLLPDPVFPAPEPPESTAITGDTGEPPSPPVVHEYPAVVPPSVDCAAVVPSAPLRLPSAGLPTPFDTRADGLVWLADGAIYEGHNRADATVVYAGGGEMVRQDPLGNLYWTADGALHRVPAGGSREVMTEDLGDFPMVPRDLELHPSGSVLIPQYEATTGDTSVAHVSPGGRLTRTQTTALVPRMMVWDVAFAADWRSLWVGAQNGLFTVPVDPLGLPDWTQRTLVEPFVGFERPDDILVDACGAVYVHLEVDFFPGTVYRFDPATAAIVALLGGVDHGYSRAPLRFGREAGRETVIGTHSGGWSTLGERWLLWDVGVEAPGWAP